MNDRIVKKYCREVKKHCPRNFCKRIISNLYNDVYDFADSIGDVTYDKICERFGIPEIYAKEYISSIETANIKKYTNKWKPIVLATITAIVIALLIYVTAITVMVIDGLGSSADYHKVEIHDAGGFYETIG